MNYQGLRHLLSKTLEKVTGQLMSSLIFLQESLESALMGTHQELEMFGSQPAYPEKLLHKKESLQNQLINIRVELSQATTVSVWGGGRGCGCWPPLLSALTWISPKTAEAGCCKGTPTAEGTRRQQVCLPVHSKAPLPRERASMLITHRLHLSQDSFGAVCR